MSSIYDWSLTASNNDASDSIINWLENQLPNTVNNSARAMMQRIAELLKDMGGSISAGGTANALTLTAASPFTVLTDGLIVSFKATATNTGATTISVNGLATKPIRKKGVLADVDLTWNDLRVNASYRLIYSTAANSGTGAWLLDSTPSEFDSGTRLIFQQSTAPTGWSKDTTHNDKALRVVSGTVGSGGTVAFSAAFSNQNVDATTLTAAQIPAHTHSVSGVTGGENQDHTHSVSVSGSTSSAGGFTITGLPDLALGAQGGPGYLTGNGRNQTVAAHTHTVTASGTSAGVSNFHTHNFSATSSSVGSGGSHTHGVNLAVQYVDTIIAQRF